MFETWIMFQQNYAGATSFDCLTIFVGRGRSHKGRARHFTSEDELARQAHEVKNWRVGL